VCVGIGIVVVDMRGKAEVGDEADSVRGTSCSAAVIVARSAKMRIGTLMMERE
jgi:hypothetical protein